jgi:hypothetical protein
MDSQVVDKVFLGISKLNGGLFIADQDTLIKLKVCFRPYKSKYEYKRFNVSTVYAMTRGCEKLLVAYFNKHHMDVRVMLEYTARKKPL